MILSQVAHEKLLNYNLFLKYSFTANPIMLLIYRYKSTLPCPPYHELIIYMYLVNLDSAEYLPHEPQTD